MVANAEVEKDQIVSSKQLRLISGEQLTSTTKYKVKNTQARCCFLVLAVRFRPNGPAVKWTKKQYTTLKIQEEPAVQNKFIKPSNSSVEASIY